MENASHEQQRFAAQAHRHFANIEKSQMTSLSFKHRGRRAPFGARFLRGFSLVEIMVAMVIGMIGVIVIMQVARTGEAQKRVTTGAGEAQNNGAMAIYAIQRDIKQAGYGFNALSVLGCELTLPAPPAAKTVTLAPVVINPSTAIVPIGDDYTDTLLIIYGSSNGSPEGDTIVSATSTGSPQTLGMMSASNFNLGEWVLAAPPTADGAGDCSSSSSLKLGKIANFLGTMIQTDSDIGAKDTGILFDLGRTPRVVAYAIRDGNLTMCDYRQTNCGVVSNWTIIANGIVGLRAQYGPTVWDQTTPTVRKDWADISAVRLALVARNGEPSRDMVNDESKCLPWAGGDVSCSGLTLPILNGHYRYQVYETVMPLRNIPWMGS
jgi:type IV pilus assembly protein PilW